ncbi:head-tail joining protein [Acetobacter persici]|uniref:head-tail joining protein n=1 Tax=Acetobacter persici TaxID=1076596 RepID=UPI001BAC7B4C|nr:hypothetical protein [Acetobacter persici]MBS1014486.1 hypothetical protein [Acetobacter persici]
MGPVDFDKLVIGPCNDVFGEAVQYQSALLGKTITLSGIFDDGYRAVSPLGDLPGQSPTHITGSDARIGVRLSLFPVLPAQGDLLTIRGRVWRIREVQPDSHGGAHIELNAADGENDALPCGITGGRGQTAVRRN